jgi:hypothetical protein
MGEASAVGTLLEPFSPVRRWILAVSTAVSLITVGCDSPCPPTACDGDGLAIYAVPEDGNPLRDGNYELWIAADGVEFLARCSLSELADARCEAESIGDPSVEIGIGVAGDDVPRDLRVHVRRTTASGVRGPDSVAVAVALDGAEIGSADYAPNYAGNARAEALVAACGTCERATVMLDLRVE